MFFGDKRVIGLQKSNKRAPVDTGPTKSDIENNPKICATICATSLTAYWWVQGMFFGDKRVTDLPKSNKMTMNLR